MIMKMHVLSTFYIENDDEDSSRSFNPGQSSDNSQNDQYDDDNVDDQNNKKSVFNNNFEQDKANESYEYSDEEEEIAVKAPAPKESLLDDAKFRK